MDLKDPIRKAIMSLSVFCGVSLFLLGMLTKQYDTDYIILAVLTFISAYLDPYIKLAYKRYKERLEEEKRQMEEAIRRKAIQEKLKQKEIEDLRLFEEQQERERRGKALEAQDQLKQRSKDRTRIS